MTQNERVLARLVAAGSSGTYVNDWDRGPGKPAVDGGPRITRLAARIRDLKDAGHRIVSLKDAREGFDVYVLVGHAQAPVSDLGGGWVEAHYCRRCDVAGVRPCGPVCPSCGGSAVATWDYDARKVARTERRAA